MDKDTARERIEYYQSEEYKELLREKNVLDAFQFLHTSFLYLNYALITRQLYNDTRANYKCEGIKDPFSPDVEIMNFHYSVDALLNKLSFEWISHISNAMDCLLQYINSALCLRLSHQAVKSEKMGKEVKQFENVFSRMDNLWNDKTVKYVRSFNNYSKHTIDLFGGSSLIDALQGDRDIIIPDFIYRGKLFESKRTSQLMGYYDTIFALFIDVLEAVYNALCDRDPISNRLHIAKVIIGKNSLGKKEYTNDIEIKVNYKEDGITVRRFWTEEVIKEDVEIMMMHSKIIGQNLSKISCIEVTQNGKLIGKLHAKDKLQDSTLQYIKYTFEREYDDLD